MNFFFSVFSPGQAILPLIRRQLQATLPTSYLYLDHFHYSAVASSPSCAATQYLSPSFPQATDEWDSSCISVFTQWGELVIYWLVPQKCPTTPPPPPSIKLKRSLWGYRFTSALLFRLQWMFYYITDPGDLLLWPACSSVVAAQSQKLLRCHQGECLNCKQWASGCWWSSCWAQECIFCKFSFFSPFTATELLMAAHHELSLTPWAGREKPLMSLWRLVFWTRVRAGSTIRPLGKQSLLYIWRQNYLQGSVIYCSAAWR